jgi:hypothetical protein
MRNSIIPLVFNENLERLIQVNMQGSVGVAGVNRPDDSKLIQMLLNAVPTTHGGPSTKLVVDGLVGQRTIAAIRNYQLKQLYFSDGRVDVGGKTIRSIIPLLQNFNKLPTNAPGLGEPSNEIKAGLIGYSKIRNSIGFQPIEK